MARKKSASTALINLNKNIQDVRRLMKIASERKAYNDKQVLRHAAIVLFTACWETFIEDLAQSAFEFLCKRAKRPKMLPNTLKSHISDNLKKEKNPLIMWELAGSGWKKFIKKHGKTVISNTTDGVSNPSGDTVDNLFLKMIGLKNLSKCWKWRGVSSAESTRRKLGYYLKVRGQIAHRTSPDNKITRNFVFKYTDFIFRLAVRSNNKVREYLIKVIKKEPWPSYSYSKTS